MHGCMPTLGTILQQVQRTAGGGAVLRQLGRQYGGGIAQRGSGKGAAVGGLHGQKQLHLVVPMQTQVNQYKSILDWTHKVEG